MNLDDFIGKHEFTIPSPDTRATPTDWLWFCDLEIVTGRLWMGDPCNINPDDGCEVSVAPGEYSVDAICLDYDGARFVSSLRVKAKYHPTSLGEEVGQTGTDSGAICVVDPGLILPALESQPSMYDLLHSHVNMRCGIISLGANAVIPYVNSGVGDGTGEVLGLFHNGKLVGVQQVFLPENFLFSELS